MTSTTPRWRRTGVGRKRELPFNERTVEVARRLLANQEFQQLLDEVTSFALYFGKIEFSNFDPMTQALRKLCNTPRNYEHFTILNGIN